jgi:hypothetical protein
MTAQRQKAGMHFTGDSARVRPRGGIGRPQTGAGEFLRQVFQDRQRFPHAYVAVD